MPMKFPSFFVPVRSALAKKAGTRVILDIDYRPVLWKLVEQGAGEERDAECLSHATGTDDQLGGAHERRQAWV